MLLLFLRIHFNVKIVKMQYSKANVVGSLQINSLGLNYMITYSEVLFFRKMNSVVFGGD